MRETAMSSAWFVPQPKDSAALRLFCFPYAGGGASVFRDWVGRLPTWIDVVAIQLPGRETRFRESAFTRLEPLVQALKQALLPFLDRPFVFFGHSMGALIAFELARQVRASVGLQPARLFVSGRGAPQLPNREEAIHALPETEFVEHLRRLNGTPEELLDHAELVQLLLPTVRADFAACETYCFSDAPPLDCPITALGGLKDDQITRDELNGWREQTRAAFHLKMLPGDHFFLRSAQAMLLQILADELGELACSSHQPAPMLRSLDPWCSAPQFVRLGPRQTHVWRASLDLDPAYIERLQTSLALDELRRANRFHFDRDRLRFIAGRGLLRAILGRYLSVTPDQLCFCYGPKGKPALAVGSQQEPLRFNMAHSNGFALFAVSRGKEIGVDLEFIPSDFDCDQTADQAFSRREMEQLRQLATPASKRALFFKCWTRKEAYLKAVGIGLSHPPNCLDAALDSEEWYQSNGDPDDAAHKLIWSIRDLPLGADFAGVIAVQGQIGQLRCWTWQAQPA